MGGDSWVGGLWVAVWVGEWGCGGRGRGGEGALVGGAKAENWLGCWDAG